MSKKSTAIWLNASPSLRWVDQLLLRHLTRSNQITLWEYSRSLDEASSLETAVELLHEYIMSQRAGAAADSKIHLAGHGISGVVGLLYARQFPHHVAL